MAENQGVLGDMWNDCAVSLIKQLHWEHIGDKNFDMKGTDEKSHGIDAIACYKSPSLHTLQSCLIESKRYAESNIKISTIKDWIDTLRKKIEIVYYADDLQTEFPTLQDCCNINLGIIMCWVHDAPNEEYFVNKFNKMVESVIINTPPKANSTKRIMVLANPQILRLCSMLETVRKYSDFKFIYPSQLIKNKPLVKTDVLSIEYMMSNIIVAEGVYNNSTKELIVYYFGNMNVDSFRIIYEALTLYNLVENEMVVSFYYYESNDRTREILPELKKIFKDVKIYPKQLNRLNINTEPAILKEETYE